MNNTISIQLSKRSKKNVRHETIVDIVDADLDAFNWCASPTNGKIYVHRRTSKNVKISIHRVILARKLERTELLPTELVDHIDGNPLNNTRGNLRLATSQQNAFNQGKLSTNKSGYKGVHWRADAKKWRAIINLNGRPISLGYFATPELAHEAYCEAAIKYHGEFANFGTTE